MCVRVCSVWEAHEYRREPLHKGTAAHGGESIAHPGGIAKQPSLGQNLLHGMQQGFVLLSAVMLLESGERKRRSPPYLMHT